MSTLTRRPSGNRVPDYKDYMSFVSAYRNGRKEETGDDSFILPPSNGSRTAPEVSGFTGKVCDSYSSFLEKTKTKKFSSVKPPSGTTQAIKLSPPAKPKVKTEIYLEINDEVQATLKPTPQEETDNSSIALGQVEARKKLFEVKTQQESKPPTQKTKVSTLKQSFETKKPTEEITVTIAPQQIIQRINSSSSLKSEPETKNCDKPEELPNITNFHLIEKRQNELQADLNCKEKLIGQLNEALKFKTSVTVETENVKNVEIVGSIPVVNVPKENSGVPPPPPPMPNGFKQLPTINKVIKKPIQENVRDRENRSPPFSTNTVYSNETDTDNSQKSVLKNQKSSTLERTNPLVRKLAYGAMLDMYGAYHEKANSYVSTLPRQHVKKDNGLQKIIDSIAAQGGLDKLSGRSNPKAENE